MSDSVAIGKLRPAGLRARLSRLWSDSVIRKGTLSVCDQAIVSGTSFATSAVVGRLCLKEDFGVYFLALSVVLFLRGIQEQLVSAPYSVFCHRHKGADRAEFTGSLLAHQIVFLVLATLALVGFATAVSAGWGPAETDRLHGVAFAVAGAAPFLLFREFLRQLTFARLSLWKVVLLDAAVAIVQLGGLAALAFGGRLTVGNVYLVMGAGCASAAAGWWLLSADRIVFRRSRVLADWKRNWAFSKWALATHLLGCSTPYVLPWFVAAVDGTAATGVLAACTTLVGLANAFVMGVSNYLTPKTAHAFVHGGLPELHKVLKKTALLFGVVLGSFALAACLFGGWLAEFVYGEQYAGAGPILAVLAFGLLASGFGITAGNGLWVLERPAANFRADACSLCVTVIAAATLTPQFGVLGAALSSLAGACVDAGVRTWTLSRLMHIDGHLFPATEAAR